MSIKTTTQAIRTYVVPVVAMTVVFALVLVYGQDLVQGLWDGIVSTLVGLPGHLAHLLGVGADRPVSGLGCWDEVKASLPTEHLCGDVAGAPASAVNFTAYPTN
jgi:hypothetical protein